jgi:hypothetical protein
VFRRFLPLLLALAIVVGVANFLWVGIEITRAGGVPEPLAVAGVYQVNNHGLLTNVDQQTYEWLQFHLRTALVTQVLAVGAAIFGVVRLSSWVKTGP